MNDGRLLACAAPGAMEAPRETRWSRLRRGNGLCNSCGAVCVVRKDGAIYSLCEPHRKEQNVRMKDRWVRVRLKKGEAYVPEKVEPGSAHVEGGCDAGLVGTEGKGVQ